LTDYDLNQFIQFGKILTKSERKNLVACIALYLYEELQKTEDGYLLETPTSKIYFEQINTLIKNTEIKQISQSNEKIRTNIMKRLLEEFEAVNDKTNLKGPFIDEELELRKWKEKDIESFITESDNILDSINNYYSEEEYNSIFFQKEFSAFNEPEIAEIQKKEAVLLRKEALKKEFVERWTSLLEKKKNIYLLQELDKAREKLCEELYKQIEQLKKMQKIMEPFQKELGRLWDLSKGNWSNVGFEILEKYAQLIEKEPDIQKLAEYLGRMHEEENELEEKEIEETVIKQVFEIDHAGKSEFVGVHESDDFSHLLPSELSLLDNPVTENIFFVKLIEKKLLTYKLMGYDLGTIDEKRKKIGLFPKAKKKGPIIICVDTSGSMHGTPEYVAKVLCFAVLRIALLGNRRCYLVSFSTGIETLELTKFNESLPELIDFLSHSFHDGTDASPALREAVRQLQTENYKKADVLMISDFIMGRIDQEVEKKMNLSKENGTRFHSLVISSAGNPKVLEVFDNNWMYNTRSEKPFQDILKNIKVINSRPVKS